MIALKKLYGEELLRLALMLSLLRADPERFLREDSGILAGGLVNGTDWAPEPGFRIIRPDHLHPKSLDSILLERERDVFEELQSLGRWGGPNAVRESVQAYLLSGVEGNVPPNIPQLQEPEDDAASNYNFSTLENDDVEQCVTIKAEDDEESSTNEVVCNSSFCKVENDSSNETDNAVASPSNVGSCATPGFIKDLTAFRGPLLEDDSASAPWMKTEADAKNFEDGVNLSDFFSMGCDAETCDNAVDISNSVKEEVDTDVPFDGASVLLQPVKKEEDLDEDVNYFNHIDDNAVDDLIPSFYSMRPNMNGEYSIYDQNLADLIDYEETPATLEEFKRNIEHFDEGQTSGGGYEKYLIENTDVDARLGERNGSEASGGDGILRVFKSETDDEGHCSGDELTEEDMDLIEVLWKQDVDMGFCLETPVAVEPKCVADSSPGGDCLPMNGSQLPPECMSSTEKLLEEALGQQSQPAAQHEGKMRTDSGIEDPWAGLSYTVDTETGEYVLSGNERFDLLEEALQLVGLEDAEAVGLQADLKDPLHETSSNHSDPASSQTAQKTADEPDRLLANLNDTSDSGSDNSTMLAPRYPPLGHAHHHIGAVGAAAGPHHHHHHHAGVHHLHHHSSQQAVAAHHHAAHAQHHFAAAYHHQNLVRSMSMEQRWQDLATLLALPAPAQPSGAGPPVGTGAISSLAGGQGAPNMHHASGQDLQHQNLYHNHHLNAVRGHLPQPTSAYVAPPYAPLTDKSPLAATADIYGAANLGSAVAASMNVAQPQPSSVPSSASVPQPSPFYKNEIEHHGHQQNAAGIPSHVQQHHQDQMYYQQNSSSELNGTSDGFLSSILNDEDLQLMDMAMNEGMYTMRMLETANNNGPVNNSALSGAILQHHQGHNNGHQQQQQQQQQQHLLHHHQNGLHGANNENGGVLQMSAAMGSERVDASSDSAVSSMGSERVPSLSDSEWCDGGSDSAQDYHSKLRPCDGESRQPPLVAQKKHHMFGKRCFQEQSPLGRVRSGLSEQDQQASLQLQSEVKFEYEQSPAAPTATYVPDVGHLTPEMKYSCTMEFSNGLSGVQNNGVPSTRHNHNHTYSLPPAPSQPPLRPLARDKLRGRRAPEGAGSCGMGPLSRDEKRARTLGIPMTVHDIINLPMDEFNERLSKHDLNESQLSLIRDIRRRGKNKVAAQNCRKRKLDQITSLADEVRDARTRKQRLQRDRQMLLAERQRAKEQFATLYRHVFQHLRDNEGNPLSSQQFSLQQAADGAVVLVPRASASLPPSTRIPRTVERHMSSNGTSDEEIERIKIKQRKSFDQ